MCSCKERIFGAPSRSSVDLAIDTSPPSCQQEQVAGTRNIALVSNGSSVFRLRRLEDTLTAENLVNTRIGKKDALMFRKSHLHYFSVGCERGQQLVVGEQKSKTNTNVHACESVHV